MGGNRQVQLPGCYSESTEAQDLAIDPWVIRGRLISCIHGVVWERQLAERERTMY